MNYIFVVSGFTQQRHNLFDNGSHAVHEALLNWQSPTVSVRLLEWKEDPTGHARRVAATTSQSDIIAVHCYSYGAGWWFLQFAQELARLGRTVNVVVLCDPVLRHPNILRRWQAVAPWKPQVIKLPPNVLRVVHFYQTRNKPGGDKLELADTTTLVRTEELAMTHQQIDNASEYLIAAVEETAHLFKDQPED
jgi:hypothetical protein